MPDIQTRALNCWEKKRGSKNIRMILLPLFVP